MHSLNKNKNNTIVTAAKVFSLAAILVVAIGSVTMAPLTALASRSGGETGFIDPTSNIKVPPRAPAVVSGDNIYIAWWTNNTENGNEEVMFRASNDGGETFGDKINLSNTTDADSWRVEIAAEGADVIVSWWETNQTSDIPVAKLSTDGGQTFGPMMMLATNGTIASTEEEGEEGETVEDAVEEAAAGEGGGG
ncbi:MAG: hypothetical protein M3275_01480 [Thermoproteota archaeon]|nr:hypothetical protein [Thermoproteota archaeon]